MHPKLTNLQIPMDQSKSPRCATVVDPSAQIAATALIGSPGRPVIGGSIPQVGDTLIGPGVTVGHCCVIGAGTKLDVGVVVDDNIKIEQNVRIGARSLVLFRAYIAVGCYIGKDCVIGGFLTDRTTVGDNCRIFGNVIHKHLSMGRGWDDDEAQEASATIGDGVFIGFGAQVIGSVEIGDGVYVAANAVVTRSVPQNCLVRGVNEIIRR